MYYFKQELNEISLFSEYRTILYGDVYKKFPVVDDIPYSVSLRCRNDKDIIEKNDAFILVYSVNSTENFEFLENFIKEVKIIKKVDWFPGSFLI
jgi:hypothetical protein